MGLCTLATAQSYTASVKHYGPEQGLAHREVNAILQDRQGFMWFGTRFGLNRFDGQKFRVYTKAKNELDFDDVQSIAQDADGILWLMGSHDESKISLFNPLTGTAISFAEKFKKKLSPTAYNFPSRLFGSDSGSIFFATYQPAALVSYHPKSGLRSVSLPQFKTLTVERVTARNTVWAIANDNILVELTPDGRVLHQFSHPQSVVRVCYGQRNAGIDLFYFTYGSASRPESFFSVDEQGNRRELPYSFLKSLAQYLLPVCYAYDTNGLVWDGIHLRDIQKGTLLDITPQTGGESITNRSFFRDRQGRFWLGTSFGIYQVKLTRNHFQRLFYEPSNQGEKVAAVRGIQVIGDEVYANLEKLGLYRSSRSGGPVQSIYQQNVFAFAYGLGQPYPGKLVAGIRNQLLQVNLASRSATEIVLPKGLSLWTFYPVNQEQFLIGGRLGLWLFQTRDNQVVTFTRYNQFSELAQAHVLHIGADRQGAIWVCANTGLYTLDPAKGVTARYWSGGKGQFFLPADDYQHIYQDKQQVYWLATANSGLIRWDRRQHQYRQFRRSEGLSNDNIYAVYPAQGHLWLSSDFGLMQFDPLRLTTRTYFVEDGITHNEFNRIAHYQDERGRIYFGGLNGVTAFDPRDFQGEKPVEGAPLRITSFRQYDPATKTILDKTEEVINTNTLTIEPDDRSSVLDFALLNYSSAEKNIYTYRFTDVDTNWTYQSEPSLRLSNLPYGQHQLLIKAQAANGQWSANTLAITLLVERPFYLRLWFLLVLALLAGAGIRWRIWRQKLKQVRLETEIRQATARIEQDKQTIAQDKEIIAGQASDLLRLNETKSRFFANISHEFRTPLTVILGMATELRKKPDQGPRTVEQLAGLIERNGTNLLRLINQILDLSKLEAGEMHLHPVRADLIGFIRYVGESFHSMAKDRDIQLHFLFEEDQVDADFDQEKLQHIIANLLANALKFIPAGGHVYCQLKTPERWQPLSPRGYYEELVPTTHLDGPWIQFSVSDTGPGIDPVSLPRIFDRFYQTETQAGGTGIGLALVRELVVLMQGGLAVRNRSGQVGQGAEFVISLPFTRQADPATHGPGEGLLPAPRLVGSTRNDWADPDREVVGHQPVLLLVEDNNDVADYIYSCVQADYHVIRAENGQAGIDLALEKVPDLILSDVMMPVKDGFALCDTLKNDERTSHIPIVLLTARAAVSDRIAGLRRGADAYLVKPFEREELLVTLTNMLQTRQRLQSYFSQLALGRSRLGMAAPGPDPADADQALEDQFLVNLRTTLETHFTDPDFSIDTLCQLVGMSRPVLNQKLTALTGMSISRYLRSLRLHRAKELLAASDMNISQVAYAVGFEDPKYFSRLFSEEFGIAPGTFRLSTK
ncbi:hybrid sensor histidine kinase/response regulator transcription factor [Nibrella saemangeumensis]|uniref:histidine kinase n=2 Tax=Nibrella saemangeumensis TaxID=1084526 RepID=A0ABP8MS86_9BACT